MNGGEAAMNMVVGLLIIGVGCAGSVALGLVVGYLLGKRKGPQ